MVKIVIENLGQKELHVADTSTPVLRHIHAALVDWMHACGGKGRCTTCKMVILEGAENISAVTPAELHYRKESQLGANERLACQVRIKGDIRIRVPEEFKLPHMTYSE